MTVCLSFELTTFLNGVDKIAQNCVSSNKILLYLQQIKKLTWISRQTKTYVLLIHQAFHANIYRFCFHFELTLKVGFPIFNLPTSGHIDLVNKKKNVMIA